MSEHSRGENYNPPSVGETFNQHVDELATVTDPDKVEGIFRVIAFCANQALFDEVRYGQPADSEVSLMINRLQLAIGREVSDENHRHRLMGILDMVFDVARMLPPRVDDDDYSILARISEADSVPLEEVADFVYPEPEAPRQVDQITVFSIPPITSLVVVRRIGENLQVSLSPKGKAAIAAYVNRKIDGVV